MISLAVLAALLEELESPDLCSAPTLFRFDSTMLAFFVLDTNPKTQTTGRSKPATPSLGHVFDPTNAEFGAVTLTRVWGMSSVQVCSGTMIQCVL